MKQKVIAWKYIPRGLNLTFYATVWLLLDRLQPPGWVWGCVGAICALLSIAVLVTYLRQEEVETPPWPKD